MKATKSNNQEIQDFCRKISITADQFYGVKTVGGSLNLNSLTSIPEGFNPTVGFSLDLRSLTHYERLKIVINNVNSNLPFSWQNGRYIKVDGIFCEVISKRGKVYKVKYIASDKEFYIITDGNGKWSHGSTIQEAKKDLLYKIGHRDKSKYKNLTCDSEVTFEDAIEMYRVITGACSFGTRDFVENKLQKKKSKYTIAEIAEITTNQYGNKAFSEFFKH